MSADLDTILWAAFPHADEAIRDIPRNCTCPVRYDKRLRRWITSYDDTCPWHGGKA